MKILITGGSGFVGKHLVPLLQERGHDCFLFAGDIRDIEEVAKLKTTKADAVIHLAAQVNGKDSRRFFEVNVNGTQNLIEVCRQIKPCRFIFLSSIRVLSRQQNPYSLSKKVAEEIVINSEVPYVILRPSLLYGKGDKKNLGFFFTLITRLPIVPIFDFKIQPLFVGDLAKIIAGCLGLKENKIINVAGEEVVNLYDLLWRANSAINGQAFILRLPKCFTYPLKLTSYCPGFPFSWRQIQPLLNNEIFPSDPWQFLFNIKPTKLTDGLIQTLR